MLDIRRIREQTDTVKVGVENKNGAPSLVDDVLAMDEKRRSLLTEVETQKSRRNAVSKQIGIKKRNGEDTAPVQQEMKELGQQISALDGDLRELETALRDATLRIPNIPHVSTPIGTDETANEVVRTWGEPKTFDFEPKPHFELIETLGLLDFPRSTRLAGAGFPFFTGVGARLQRALIQFMLDLHTTEHGYTEMSPPFVVNTAAMTGTGQLPKMAEDMYEVPKDGLWLIPTAEVPITNYYRDEIIEQPLPIYLAAYTPCFRREAGAAGKDTRGLTRVHQFDKVEMVKFVRPDTSYDEFEALVGNAETVLQKLGLHYRVLSLCSGDISFAAAKCFDLELWAPGHEAWLEVSSCSNFEDFQARRAGIRYRDENGKPQFIHTLNGSGVALPRLYIAILESGQQADGSVVLPEAIVPYMGGVDRLVPVQS